MITTEVSEYRTPKVSEYGTTMKVLKSGKLSWRGAVVEWLEQLGYGAENRCFPIFLVDTLDYA